MILAKNNGRLNIPTLFMSFAFFSTMPIAPLKLKTI